MIGAYMYVYTVPVHTVISGFGGQSQQFFPLTLKSQLNGPVPELPHTIDALWAEPATQALSWQNNGTMNCTPKAGMNTCTTEATCSPLLEKAKTQKRATVRVLEVIHVCKWQWKRSDGPTGRLMLR